MHLRKITPSRSRHTCSARPPIAWLLFLISALSLSSLNALDVRDYIDAHDTRYVRIKCIWQDKYLYHNAGEAVVKYSNSISAADPRSHWYIEESPHSGRYWVRSRTTGEAWHIENQMGALQLADLKESFTSYRWKFNTRTDLFRIQSAWQSSNYLSVEDTSTVVVGYDALVSAWYSQRFRIEYASAGATAPWQTYDESNTTNTGGGADILNSTYYRWAIQSEAQKRSAILLDSYGSFVSWTLSEAADSFTLRYAVPDSSTGGGSDGTISLYVDGVFNREIEVTSKQAWVYFDSNMNEYDVPGTGLRPGKRFNEARFQFSNPIPVNSTIEFRRDGGDRLIWIDLLEAETRETINPATPTEFYDVTDYGAIAGDSQDDWQAFEDCIDAAILNGKGVFIPAGIFQLSDKLELAGVQIMGAGIWNTELHFTNETAQKGGINAIGSNTIVSDFYMRAPIAERKPYNALRGYWGTNSRIENIWTDQFTVGLWIADYTGAIEETDGLVVRNCRIRNTFADGINFAKGTQNSLVENCHIRTTGDDSLASWSSDPTEVEICKNNVFRYNTIECTYRAAGIGVFGGEAHRIHSNIVRDIVSGPGLRFNTTFADNGYAFSSTGTIEVYNNELIRTGTLNGWGSESGAINLRTRYGDVRNIRFRDIIINNTEDYGIWFSYLGGTNTSGSFSNIDFENIDMQDVGYGSYILSDATGSCDFTNVTVSLKSSSGGSAIQNNSSNFTINNNGGNTGL